MSGANQWTAVEDLTLARLAYLTPRQARDALIERGFAARSHGAIVERRRYLRYCPPSAPEQYGLPVGAVRDHRGWVWPVLVWPTNRSAKAVA